MGKKGDVVVDAQVLASATEDILVGWQVQRDKLAKNARQGKGPELAQAVGLLALPSPAEAAALLEKAVKAAREAGLPASSPEEALLALLSRALGEHLPRLMKEGEEAARALQTLSREQFNLVALRAAYNEIRDVAEGLGMAANDLAGTQREYLQGLDGLALAQVLARFMLRRYVQPFTPAWIYPSLERSVVGGMEFLYRTRLHPAPQPLAQPL